MRESRSASRSSWAAKRETAAGSSSATERRVSAAAWIEAAGVFSSCEAFATKSRRTDVDAAGIGDVGHDHQGPSRRLRRAPRSRAATARSAPLHLDRDGAEVLRDPTRRPRAGPTGTAATTDAGRLPRCRSSAALANAVPSSGVEQEDALLHRRRGSGPGPPAALARGLAHGSRAPRAAESRDHGPRRASRGSPRRRGAHPAPPTATMPSTTTTIVPASSRPGAYAGRSSVQRPFTARSPPCGRSVTRVPGSGSESLPRSFTDRSLQGNHLSTHPA